MMIDADFFPLNGFWINRLTEILFLDNTLVIDDKTPFLSITSNLKYEENILFDISSGAIFFLFTCETEKGNFKFPLKTEHISDTSAEVVGPGPAPSPLRTNFPIGLPSIITAFNTPFTLLIWDSFLIKHGCTLCINLPFSISLKPICLIL